MRVILSVVALVAFASGPALGATCLRACSATHAGNPHESSCHQAAVPEHRVAGEHDCSVHVAPLGVTSKRLELGSQLPIAVSVAIVLDVVRVESNHANPSVDRLHQAPRPPSLVPLRI